MKDKEGIGNSDGSKATLGQLMLEFAKKQIQFDDRQKALQNALSSLTQIERRNIEDIEIVSNTFATDDDINNFIEVVRCRFDILDKKLDTMLNDIIMLRKRGLNNSSQI